MSYRSEQNDRNARLINEQLKRLNDGFYGGSEGIVADDNDGHQYILKHGKLNLYKEIREEALEYFRENNISWWTEKWEDASISTGSTTSSQVACVNHLFPIRDNYNAMLRLLKGLDTRFFDVMKITYNENNPEYVAFEVAFNKGEKGDDFLKEHRYVRGAFATSIDAMIFAKHSQWGYVLVIIEWKYAESYGDEDGTTEDKSEKPLRLSRYKDLIDKSDYLKPLHEYKGSVYYHEPFYELMRQTLWAEQMIKKNVIISDGNDPAKQILHLDVIPSGNDDLLNTKYKVSGKGLKATWKGQLQDDYMEHYKIVDPEALFWPIAVNPFVGGENYYNLVQYLRKRYWDDEESAEKK